MSVTPTMHPLKYIATALVQMAAMLKDFDMPESAQLLEKVRTDIERKLAEKPEKTNAKT